MKPYYERDGITIYNGDAYDLIKQIKDNSIDVVITDPPYKLNNGSGNSRWREKKGIKSRNILLEGLSGGFNHQILFPEFQRVCKKTNVFVFCSNSQILSLMSIGENSGHITTLLVWNKFNAPPFSYGTWRQDAEFIIHIRESGATFQGRGELKNKVVRMPLNQSKYGHPTEKPVELIERYISVSCNKGDMILDPFMGSGTTLVAAKQLGMKAVGIELEQKYCDIAIERLAQGVMVF